MKSFFEFYNHLRTKKLNEQQQMNPPPAGGQPPAGGMGMDAGMGMGGNNNAAGMGMNDPNTAGAGANQPGVIGQDMDLDMGASDESPEGMSKQTDEPIGEQDPSQLMDNLKQLMNFVKNFGVGDDQDKSEKKDELSQQLQAVMENLGQLTGTEVPSDDSQPDGEMGGEQPDSESEEGGLPTGDSSGMGSGGASPLGGNMPSDASGSGDMGGNMAGGSTPNMQGGGMGGMGGGQFGM